MGKAAFDGMETEGDASARLTSHSTRVIFPQLQKVDTHVKVNALYCSCRSRLMQPSEIDALAGMPPPIAS